MAEKKFLLSSQKVEELKNELVQLETKGREKIADSLDWLRSLPSDQEDATFSDIFEDQRFLEKRISEIKTILCDYEIIKTNINIDIIDIGSVVKVGFGKSEEKYEIVSALEANPLSNKISNESPVGRALIGHKEGDVIKVDIGLVSKEYRILEIK